MLKHDELKIPNSCFNKARDNEMLFVLLGRDPAGPAAIEAWIEARIRLGLNFEDDKKICEARECILNWGQLAEEE